MITPPSGASPRPLLTSANGSGGGMTRTGMARIDAIDALRGLVIILMVLDHDQPTVRRFA